MITLVVLWQAALLAELGAMRSSNSQLRITHRESETTIARLRARLKRGGGGARQQQGGGGRTRRGGGGGGGGIRGGGSRSQQAHADAASQRVARRRQQSREAAQSEFSFSNLCFGKIVLVFLTLINRTAKTAKITYVI